MIKKFSVLLFFVVVFDGGEYVVDVCGFLDVSGEVYSILFIYLGDEIYVFDLLCGLIENGDYYE